MDELLHKVERIERRSRLWMLACLACGCVAFLVGAGSQQGQKAITADRLAITDKQGHERIVLSVTDGSPKIQFLDEDGDSRMILESDTETSLQFYDRETHAMTVELYSSINGLPRMSFRGRDARKRVVLDGDAKGGGLTIYGENEVEVDRFPIR